MPGIIASGACPTSFRAQCHEAAGGGGQSFADVGRSFAGTILKLSPDSMEDREWAEEVVDLAGLIGGRRDDEVLAWLDQRLPRCMKLVPGASREDFLAGLYLAVFEDEVDIAVD